MAKKAKTAYVCDNCGYESIKWLGCCPICGEWNTMQEFKIAPTSKNTPVVALKKVRQSRYVPWILRRGSAFLFLIRSWI